MERDVKPRPPVASWSTRGARVKHEKTSRQATEAAGLARPQSTETRRRSAAAERLPQQPERLRPNHRRCGGPNVGGRQHPREGTAGGNPLRRQQDGRCRGGKDDCPARRWPPASRKSCSTVASTSITAGLPPWPMPPVKRDWFFRGEWRVESKKCETASGSSLIPNP